MNLTFLFSDNRFRWWKCTCLECKKWKRGNISITHIMLQWSPSYVHKEVHYFENFISFITISVAFLTAARSSNFYWILCCYMHVKAMIEGIGNSNAMFLFNFFLEHQGEFLWLTFRFCYPVYNSWGDKWVLGFHKHYAFSSLFNFIVIQIFLFFSFGLLGNQVQALHLHLSNLKFWLIAELYFPLEFVWSFLNFSWC